jgi:hypothetical protein
MQNGAALSIPAISERGAFPRQERMVPIAAAAERLGRSVHTLKRMFRKGLLPVRLCGGDWLVYESFLEAVLARPRPGEARRVEDIAAEWFAAPREDRTGAESSMAVLTTDDGTDLRILGVRRGSSRIEIVVDRLTAATAAAEAVA